jgi:hypothetical protein
MTKRPTGRPPLDATDPTVRVGLSLPAKQFDALCVQAERAAVSVPEVIRRLLADATPEYKSLK